MNNQPNNSQPQTRPLGADKPLDDLFPNRFLKADDMLRWGKSILIVTIDHLQEEQVTPKPGQPAEWKPVLYFKTKAGSVHPQGYLLSAKVDKDALKAATGAQTIGQLAGKRIAIKIDEYKRSKVLRIDFHPAGIDHNPPAAE
jgi:hypothetical protein